MHTQTFAALVRRYVPPCPGAHPSCGHVVTGVVADMLDGGLVCSVVCGGCLRRRSFCVSGNRVRQVYINSAMIGDLAWEIVGSLTLPFIAPFGAGPATT